MSFIFAMTPITQLSHYVLREKKAIFLNIDTRSMYIYIYTRSNFKQLSDK